MNKDNPFWNEKHPYWQALIWIAEGRQIELETAFGWVDVQFEDALTHILNGGGVDSIALSRN